MNGDIQYISDTLLLEKTFKILSSLEADPFNKKAGIIDNLKSSIGSGIDEAIKQHVSFDSPESTIHTVIGILQGPVLWAIGGWQISLLATAAQVLWGIDIYTIIKKLVQIISGMLQVKKQLSFDDVTNAIRSVMPAGLMEEKKTAGDFLFGLRELEEQGKILKAASYKIPKEQDRLIVLAAGASTQPAAGNIKNLLSFMGKARGMFLIMGIFRWIIVTLLMGTGLLAGGHILKKFVGKELAETGIQDKWNKLIQGDVSGLWGAKPEAKPDAKPETKTDTKAAPSIWSKIFGDGTSTVPSAPDIKTKQPSLLSRLYSNIVGKPEKSSDMVYEPLRDNYGKLRTIAELIWDWIMDEFEDQYPKLESFKEKITSSQYFKKVELTLKAAYNKGKSDNRSPEGLIMPDELPNREAVFNYMKPILDPIFAQAKRG